MHVFTCLKKTRMLGSICQPDDGQGEGVDHQVADDSAAEWTSLPWGLLLPGGTDGSTFVGAGSKRLLVGVSSMSILVVGVLPTDRGQDGRGGAGHQGQEGATKAHDTIHHQNWLLHSRSCCSLTSWRTKTPGVFFLCLMFPGWKRIF